MTYMIESRAILQEIESRGSDLCGKVVTKIAVQVVQGCSDCAILDLLLATCVREGTDLAIVSRWIILHLSPCKLLEKHTH